MKSEFNKLLKYGKNLSKENKLFYKKLNIKKPHDLDKMIAGIHNDVFKNIDCLMCANCCKTTSPVFRDTDIDRISKFLRIRPSVFTQTYLHLDEENDFVLNSTPCPFLGNDHCCSIYEVRPAACREYPHTNRKRFYQVIPKTLRNLEICPAVVLITEKLKEKYR